MPELLPAPGDLVWIRQRRWRVERARRAHHVLCLDVAGRGRRLTFLSPFDRVVADGGHERPRRVRPQQAVARLAGLLAGRRRIRTLATASRADLVILPHQLEPAMALTAGVRRVLIADEVGLGKTIEAGLAIAELIERRRTARVLVVAPAALRLQWADELTRRFGVSCRAADAQAIERHARAGAPGDNPWRHAGVWIASLDYLKQTHVMDALPWTPWDLVVVDEAHGACGDSARHAALDELTRCARQVLLLTATPHGGDAARFSRLVATGELADIDDRLVIFRRTRAQLGMRLDRRVRWHRVGLSDAEAHAFDVLAAYETAVLRAAGDDRRDAALLLLSVFRKRALSTMHALVTSVNRRLRWLGERQANDGDDDLFWLQPRLAFDDESDAVGEEERDSLTAHVGLDAAQERAWLRRLRVLAETAQRHESKIARLVSLVGRSHEPVAIFTEFRHSLDAVGRRLERVRSVSVLHGGLTPAEQQTALDQFRSGRTSVLLATDVASLGLNLQMRTRWVVSLELPWNPVRLEQRAGRVDRIGQTRRVHITLLVARHPAEVGVLLRLATRTLAARHALGEDVLPAAIPDAQMLRASLIGGAPLEEPAAPSQAIALCRTWTRHAHAAARGLERLRVLASHWRAPVRDGRAVSTRHPRLAAMAATSGDGLLVFSVPLIDPSGDVPERHVVAVRVARTRQAADQDLVAAARKTAAAALAARVGRLRRLRAAGLETLVARERAVTQAVVAARCPEEVQTGLFDRRALRAATTARRDADDLRDACGERIRELEAGLLVDVGRPVLELIVAPR